MFGRKKKKKAKDSVEENDVKFLPDLHYSFESDADEKYINGIRDKVRENLKKNRLPLSYLPYILSEKLYYDEDKLQLLEMLEPDEYEEEDEVKAYILINVDFETEQELIMRKPLLDIKDPKYVYMVLTDAKISKEERKKLEDVLKKSDSIQYKFYYEYLKGNKEIIKIFKENDLGEYLENSKIFDDREAKLDFLNKCSKLETISKNIEISNSLGKEESIDEETKWQYVKIKQYIPHMEYDSRIRFPKIDF